MARLMSDWVSISTLRRLSRVLLLAGVAWMLGAMAASPNANANAPSQDVALVQQVAAELGSHAAVRAGFVQTQTLAALSRPAVSRGSLLFVRERGIIWRIESPYRATFVIGNQTVSEIGPDGKPLAGNSHALSGMEQMTTMMRAMLSGDLSALYSQFKVQASGTPAHWQLHLTPDQPQLAQALKGLDMSGGEYLTQLRITAANGDSTQIEFVRTGAAPTMSADEQALLGAHAGSDPGAQ